MSNVFCSVYGCSMVQKKNRNISFHTFPKAGAGYVEIENKFGKKEKVDRLKAWILELKIGKPVTRYMKVCSRHFKGNDYFYREQDTTKRKFLKKTAVPSENLPLQKQKEPNSRSERFIKRNVCKEQKQETINTSTTEESTCVSAEYPSTAEENTGVLNSSSEKLAAEALLLLSNCKDEALIKNRDAAIQVNTPSITTVCELMSSDSTLNTFTGLNSHSLLYVVVQLVEGVHKDTRVHRLDVRQRIILTFTKMKCDLSYALLSKLFGITPDLCKTYIFEMLPVIASALKKAIKFPSKEEICKNIPKCFKFFQDTRAVLDCTEIAIQNPKCLCCRIKFYSHYKTSQTVKFMTAVSPAGLITFVSEPYGGRASDKALFEQSNFITHLDEGDAIMVDKGFLVEDMCAKFKIKLYRPPFLKNKQQLSAEQAIFNTKIAAARVHIERCNQRIKQFKILCGKMQWTLVPLINDIFTIACAVTNLSAPILADDKFLRT